MQKILLTLTLLFAMTCAQAAVVFHDTKGDAISPKSLKGKWVIVNYWAAWCSGCVKEIPELNSFYQHNKGNNVVLYGVNFDQPPLGDLKQAMAKVKIAFPVLVEDPSQTMKLSEVDVLPTTFVINPDGKVMGEIVGPSTEKYLADYLHGLQGSSA